MFERYTERARRVLFFARYEASQLGSILRLAGCSFDSAAPLHWGAVAAVGLLGWAGLTARWPESET